MCTWRRFSEQRLAIRGLEAVEYLDFAAREEYGLIGFTCRNLLNDISMARNRDHRRQWPMRGQAPPIHLIPMDGCEPRYKNLRLKVMNPLS